jgi:pimeloyl-ACP methyl ester carboxylesterase
MPDTSPVATNLPPTSKHRWRNAGLTSAAVLACSWLLVQNRTRQAEKEHPPAGRFIEIDGTRLHYLEQGEGPVLVLMHGNVVTADDFRLSGLMERLARNYRVIAFDRPGFGYSDRPRTTTWTPEAQAQLLHNALRRLGAGEYLVLAHSWGTLVALAMALQQPDQVRGLLLLSGYYYPSMRLDVPLAAMPAIPLLGDLMRFTISPVLGRLTWPLASKGMFRPSKVPDSFRRESPWMLLRPKQVRATAAEAALMVPGAASLEQRYGELRMPVTLMAGRDDHVVNPEHNSVQLHKALPHSELTLLPNVGHMMQHLAQDEIVNALNELAGRAGLLASSLALDGQASRRNRDPAAPL